MDRIEHDRPPGCVIAEACEPVGPGKEKREPRDGACLGGSFEVIDTPQDLGAPMA